MFIIGIGSAVPPQGYTQEQCWQAVCSWPHVSRLTLRSRAILKKVLLGDNGIATRHLALAPLSEAFNLTPDALDARFAQHAPVLAMAAATTALARAKVTPEDIDGLVISTCTGYLCPGLTSYVGERLHLRQDVLALDLVGQGCGAAVPNLRTAEALIAAKRCRHVLSVCVEVCSAAFYLDDDPGVLVSACLFGDGAGAVVLSNHPTAHGRRVEWLTSQSRHSPAERDSLRFERRNGMLRNILHRQVPALAAQASEQLLADTLAGTGLPRNQINGWILHAGGRDILLALGERLGLEPAELAASTATLRNYGNVSSSSVLFTLETALSQAAGGGYWWLSSFGAGFSCHGALLKVD